ncbi:hypothetical protein K491DRAFT_681849 [Lophiostoma macrostomum CBS 122681]|uniref:Uncharacterized protein n=1 Tax=Lophiostoma macrostomum CBS 122681 TaxID=1314788 RepID=A0A6A6SWA6_9PLEO|nr:hypothetical protein K491DRAFT_681849 [Lophiostoma macrostomum CBS 122681]
MPPIRTTRPRRAGKTLLCLSSTQSTHAKPRPAHKARLPTPTTSATTRKTSPTITLPAEREPSPSSTSPNEKNKKDAMKHNNLSDLPKPTTNPPPRPSSSSSSSSSPPQPQKPRRKRKKMLMHTGQHPDAAYDPHPERTERARAIHGVVQCMLRARVIIRAGPWC